MILVTSQVLSLSEVKAGLSEIVEAPVSLADLGGVPIAIWRTDCTCISHYSTPAGPYYEIPSRFAYVDADQMRQRILDAEGSVAPPITCLDGRNQMWDTCLQKCAEAHQPGVLVEAIALYLPDTMVVALAQDPRFRAVTPLDAHRTESTDPSYAGELLTDRSPELSEAPESECD